MSSDNGNHLLRDSASFKDDELLALDSILSLVRRGGDARTIARQPAAVRAAAKVMRMRKELEQRKTGIGLTKGGEA